MVTKPGRVLPSIGDLLRLLRAQHGAPKPLPPKTAFEWVLWENVAYLADDEKRRQAFATLKREVGTRPGEILGARNTVLLDVTRHGILPDIFARKLRKAAEIARDGFDGKVDHVIAQDTPGARRRLRAFPGIGEPGAEKILVALGRARTLPLDSNGLRVLLRIGFGKSLKSYGATYRSVKSAVDVGRATAKTLFATHLLLQRHGREVCKAAAPQCGRCRLRPICAYGSRYYPHVTPK